MPTKTVIVRSVLSLGKIAYASSRKENAATLELELRETETTSPHRTVDGTTVLRIVEISICGSIWNRSHTDHLSGGQNIDDIAKYVRAPAVKRIKELWERWHLNGMKAGSRNQTNALDAHKARNPEFNYGYDACLAVLSAAGLQPDAGYSYGSARLCEPAPVEVLGELCDLFGVSPEDKARVLAVGTDVLIEATPV